MVESWQETRARHHARKANLTACRKCASPVYRGLDDDLAALTVQIDPTPICLFDESTARQNGRATFNLAGGEITYRDIWHLAAGNTRQPIHPEHHCPPPVTSAQLVLPEQVRPEAQRVH